MSQAYAPTPEPNSPQAIHVASSVPRHSTSAGLYSSGTVETSTPDPASENDLLQDNSPTSNLRRIQRGMGTRTPWRSFTPTENAVVQLNKLWPLRDPNERAKLQLVKEPLHKCLKAMGILRYSTIMANQGATAENSIPKLIILTNEFLSQEERQKIPSEISYVNLRHKSQEASHGW